MENSLMQTFIKQQISTAYQLKKTILEDDETVAMIYAIAQQCVIAYQNGHKTLIAGNGGSAADAQHIAGEFVSRFYFDRPALPSIALTTDSSILTSIGNDYGFEKIFSRQVEANGCSGDVFIGISTSGNSQNIIEALQACKLKGIVTVGLTGADGGAMAELCDYCIKVPSKDTPRIQEVQTLMGHIICSVVEEALFGKGF